MKLMDLSVFDGATKGPWKRFEYRLGSSRIYIEEPERTLITDVHKNRGAIDSNGNERPDDEIATVYNKCDSDLIFHAPDLLAENRKLRKVVEAMGYLLAFHEEQMIEFEKDYDHTVVGNEHRLGTYNRLRKAITDAKEGLG